MLFTTPASIVNVMADWCTSHYNITFVKEPTNEEHNVEFSYLLKETLMSVIKSATFQTKDSQLLALQLSSVQNYILSFCHLNS